MADPNAGLTWSNLEGRLLEFLQWPQNQVVLRGQTPEHGARQIIQEIIGAFIGLPQQVEFRGPKRFLRAVGPSENAFGSWWFDEHLSLRIEQELARIPLSAQQRQQAREGRLRSQLAVSVDWNSMSEIWRLELPAGERLTGLVGRVSSQPLYSRTHNQHDASRLLMGGGTQIYFMVKNPLWVRQDR